MNKFFAVEKPFRIWRHVGTSPSNTWIGSSRSINTVMEARNSEPGDQIHALVGGTFLVRGKEAWRISIRAPKPILEKSYGGYESDAFVLARRTDVLSEIPQPADKIDYNAPRLAIEANRLRELHPEVIEVEPSPGMELLKAMVGRYAEELSAAGRKFSVKAEDVNAYHDGRIRLTIHAPETKDDRQVTVQIGAGGMLIVDLPVGEPVQGLPFEGGTDGRGKIYLRPEVWPSTPEVAMRVLHEFVNRKDMDLKDIIEKVDEESHIAAFRLQSAVGAEDGGLASMYWSGVEPEAICETLARAVVRLSGGNVVDHGSPWTNWDWDKPFDHSKNLDDEPILARDMFLDHVEKRFGVKLGAAERRDVANRIDAVLEPYFEHERKWAEERDQGNDAPAP